MRTRALFVLALAGFFLGSMAAPRGEIINGIAAIVHDSIITYEDVEREVVRLVDQFRNQPQVLRQRAQDLRRERIELLVDQHLILHDFRTSGYNLPESIIDEIIKERVREKFGGDKVALIRTLQAEGSTLESYKQSVRDQFIVEQMRRAKVSSEIVISPHKIETYYQENVGKYKLGDQVKLRMIFVDKARHGEGVAQLAKEIHSKLTDGASFAEMAMLYSDGSQNSQGGDWGWVEKTVLREDLASVAFSLQPGQLSPVLERAEGYYLMLVEESRLAHVRPLTEVRDEIESNLKRLERNRLEKKWLDRLKSKAFVRYFPEAR